MLFAPLKTVKERISSERAKANEICRPALMSDEILTMQHDRAIKRISYGPDMIGIQDTADDCGVSVEDYRAMAERNEALLFEIPELGYATVPEWSLLDKGGVNPVAVAAAKLFACYKAGEEAASFCRFVEETFVTFDVAKIGNPTMGEIFASRAKGTVGLTMSLKDALAYVTDIKSDNGKSVLAQVKNRIHGELPMRWPAIKFEKTVTG